MGSFLTFLSGGLIGGFIGGFGKFFWEKYLPDRITWRRQQEVEREKLLSRFGGPAVRAIHELQQRIYVMVFKHPERYPEVSPENSEYKVESMSFLVAQCCARLEILRGKMEALDYATLVEKLDSISRKLAGYGSRFPMHRLQQQEIAELMLIIGEGGELQCAGYSKFLDALRKDKTLECWLRLRAWTKSILENWPDEVTRLVHIQHALVDALDTLDGSYRWVPRNRRKKLVHDEVIQNLTTLGLIDSTKAETLRQELKNSA